jgi:hypothetical protein
MDEAAALRQKARDYLSARGTLATTEAVREQVSAALATLRKVVDGVTAERAARAAIPGEWSVQEIVDHLVETFRPGVDELRCLVAGCRPPGDPIAAALQSKAPRLRPWPWLVAELRRLSDDVVATLPRRPPRDAGGDPAGLRDERPGVAHHGDQRPRRRGAVPAGRVDRGAGLEGVRGGLVAPAHPGSPRAGAQGARGLTSAPAAHAWMPPVASPGTRLAPWLPRCGWARRNACKRMQPRMPVRARRGQAVLPGVQARGGRLRCGTLLGVR